MKTKILNALKTKYATMGLGDKAFDGVASFLEKTITDENDIATKIDGDDVKALLKAFQGESDSLRTARLKAEKDLADYKKAHPEEDPDAGKDTNNALMQMLKTMQEKQDRLEAQLAARSADEKKATILADLKSKITSYPEQIVRLALKDLAVGENDTADTHLEAVQKSCADLYAEFYGNGAVPPGGNRFAPTIKDDPNEFKAGVEELKSRGLYPDLKK